MASKWITLNLLLLIAAVGLAREFYQQYEQFKTKNDPVKIEPVSMENQAATKAASGTSTDNFMEIQINNDADYFIISEKTIFSDLRGNEIEIAPVAAKVAPLPNPKPVLVGTVMVDGQYIASVINQLAQQQARNTQLNPETWRVGDLYRGYTVVSIEADQLVLENGGAREVIPLNRAARRSPAAKPPTNTATRVVSIGPGGGASGAITVSVAAAAQGRGALTAAQNAAARQGQIQQATQQAQQAAQQTQQAAQQPRSPVQMPPNGEVVVTLPETMPTSVQVAQPVQQVVVQPAQKSQTGAGAKPAQGIRQQPQQQRIVRTPFGEIIRSDSE